jgi:hypothetical protein
VNILAHFSAIPERLVGMVVLGLKDVDSIGKLKNGYHVLIVESLHPLLVGDVHYMLEVIMLPDTMIDFDKKELMLADSMLADSIIDFDQKYKKEVMRK